MVAADRENDRLDQRGNPKPGKRHFGRPNSHLPCVRDDRGRRVVVVMCEEMASTVPETHCQPISPFADVAVLSHPEQTMKAQTLGRVANDSQIRTLNSLTWPRILRTTQLMDGPARTQYSSAGRRCLEGWTLGGSPGIFG
jgi:hypothetical protein